MITCQVCGYSVHIVAIEAKVNQVWVDVFSTKEWNRGRENYQYTEGDQYRIWYYSHPNHIPTERR